MGNKTSSLLKDSLIAEKDSRLAEKDSRLAEKDIRLAESAALHATLAEERKRYTDERERSQALVLAQTKYQLDLTLGRVEVRTAVEAIVGEVQEMCEPPFKGKGTTNVLEYLFRSQPPPCPGLIAFLSLAAEDNGVSRSGLLDSARLLFSNLSTHLHSRVLGAEGGGGSLPQKPCPTKTPSWPLQPLLPSPAGTLGFTTPRAGKSSPPGSESPWGARPPLKPCAFSPSSTPSTNSQQQQPLPPPPKTPPQDRETWACTSLWAPLSSQQQPHYSDV